MNAIDRLLIRTIRSVAHARFGILPPGLSDRTRYIIASDPQALPSLEPFKTYDYFLRQLEGLIRGVYSTAVTSDFIDIMANLISGQLTQAFTQAWEDEGDGGDLPDYLSSAADAMISDQYGYVDQLYRDIVNARELQNPIEPILIRAPMWANRWNDAYNQAVHLITVQNGGKEEWVYGDTEHCETCLRLNGIVAYASTWDELDVHPQHAPNDKLDCEGWNCACSRQPTDKRRTPNARDKIAAIVGGG